MSGSAWVRGVGVHSGLAVGARLQRVDADAAIAFRRRDVRIEAHARNVVATPSCTVLGVGEARIAVVEHLLAALRFAGFWRGVEIEVDGDELPILDGSAAPWLDAIGALGTPPAAPAPLAPRRSLEIERAGGRATVEPGDAALDVTIDFAHPAIGRQTWSADPNDLRRLTAELADARTFGFLDQVEALRAAGRARGASLENAIVFGDAAPLRPLRHDDEPVRHKALDALGDLALVQAPVRAAIRIERGSHELHVALAHALLAASDSDVA